MKKKVFIVLIIILIFFLISIFIPVRKGEEWINDSDIYDIGYFEECYYNIYGVNLTMLFKIILNFK